MEAWASYRVVTGWRLSAGLVELRQHLQFRPGSAGVFGLNSLGNDPEHSWQIRSQLNVGARAEFDVFVRHAGKLPDPEVPAYTAVDARLGWNINPRLDVSLIGQNLIDAHIEYGNSSAHGENERSAVLKIVWQN